MSVFSELFYWFRVALFSAGTKIIAGIILLSVSATLFLSPSLRVCFFFSLCSVYALLFSSVPPLLTLRGWYRPAVSLLWVFFFLCRNVCRDEGNRRDNSLCIFLGLCSAFFSSVPPLVSGFIFFSLHCLCSALPFIEPESLPLTVNQSTSGIVGKRSGPWSYRIAAVFPVE